ncbi:MAG: alkaline phosphatase family protein, partial [Candidatus Tectomicrobia bacterium]|nr:alkaline phosphatase family protein [Candidatus Tectomicrobia bacterium]
VYPTLTRVCSSSVATGSLPGQHGIMGNSMFLPEIDSEKPFSTGDYTYLQQLHKMAGRAFFSIESLGEVLTRSGKKMAVVSTGTSGQTFLLNHTVESGSGITINPQFILPKTHEVEILSRFGPFPPAGRPNRDRIRHAARLLLNYVLPEIDPDLTIFWMSDPDGTQHYEGVGSPTGSRAIQEADVVLHTIVESLNRLGRREVTDLIILSDHGHDTISKKVDLSDIFSHSDLAQAMRNREIIIAQNSGSDLIYIPSQNEALIEQVITFLQRQPWSGVIFTDGNDPIKGRYPGTFSFNSIGYRSARSPDIAFSFAWESSPNRFGITGVAPSDSDLASGGGDHGSISPFTMRNMMIASGPGFKQGLISTIPTGLIDIAPTALALLGLSPPSSWNGRIIQEALRKVPHPADLAFETEQYRESIGEFSQTLQISRVGSTFYIDKGERRLG